MPYRITQCYMPPGRGGIPALTPAKAGTRFATPKGCKAELTLTSNLNSIPNNLHSNPNNHKEFTVIGLRFRLWLISTTQNLNPMTPYSNPNQGADVSDCSFVGKVIEEGGGKCRSKTRLIQR